MEPVSDWTCRLTAEGLPLRGKTEPSARISSSVGVWLASPVRRKCSIPSANLRYSCSLIGKYTLIGSICDTVVMIVVGEIRSPIWDWVMPATPSIGEVILVHSRFSFAAATAAWAASTAAWLARTSWTVLSYSRWLTAPTLTRGRYLASFSWLRRRFALAWARSPRALSRSAWYWRGSSW